MTAVPYSRMIFGVVPWYSFLIVCGAALAVFLSVKEEKRCGLPKDTIIDLTLWLLPFGIIGARIYYVAFAFDQFRDYPISILYIWEGGIAIYGAVIAGFLVIVLFCKKRNIPVLRVCDTVAPGVVLAQGIGRWGNYFNMEAFGEKITHPSFQFFPFGVLIPENGQYTWHMATFFYESIWDFGVFLLLIIFRKQRRGKTGDLFFMYLFFYSAGRIVIEDFRMDSLYASSVRISQLLSLCLISFILIFLLFRARKGGPIRPLFLVLYSLHSITSVFVLLYCFRLPTLNTLSLSQRFCFLGLYSALSILVFALIYQSVLKTEVPDADNPV